MGKIFDYLGVSTGCITNELDDQKGKSIICVTLLMQLTMNWAFDYLKRQHEV